nr:hypothetical protein [Prescottella equi]
MVGDEDVVRRMVPDALDQVGIDSPLFSGLSMQVRSAEKSEFSPSPVPLRPRRRSSRHFASSLKSVRIRRETPVAAEIVSESASGPEHPGQFGIGLFGGLQVDCLANLIWPG